MIRLFLKIHSLTLRLRGEVAVHCQIRKGHQYCPYPEQTILKGGKAVFQKQMEIFLEADNPQIEIQIILVCGQTKKLGGLCSIDLREWEENSTHHSSYHLQKSPDSKGLILFDFLYMKTNITVQNHDFFSSSEYQELKKKKIISSMQNQYRHLSSQNERLSSQISHLIEENKQLHEKQEKMEEEYCKEHQKYQKEISMRNEKIYKSECSLEDMRGKIERMREMVESSGEMELRKMMFGILNEKVGESRALQNVMEEEP